MNEVCKIVEKIQHIFTDTDTAYICEPKSRKTLNTNKPKQNNLKTHKPWYKSNCKKLKRQISYFCKNLTKYPTNPYLRGKFFTLRKKYKSLIKQEHRKYEESLTNTLETLYQKNHNTEFWKCLKNMTQSNTNDNANSPNLNDLLIYNQQDDSLNNQKMPTMKETRTIPSSELNKINQHITYNDVKTALLKLKNKKARGFDRMSKEMLIITDSLINILKELFNKILNAGVFPKQWNYSLIKTIFKGGDKDNPSDYRGISLNSTKSFVQFFTIDCPPAAKKIKSLGRNKQLLERIIEQQITYVISDGVRSTKYGNYFPARLTLLRPCHRATGVKNWGRNSFTVYINLK